MLGFDIINSILFPPLTKGDEGGFSYIITIKSTPTIIGGI
jgi:hypothetical protein